MSSLTEPPVFPESRSWWTAARFPVALLLATLLAGMVVVPPNLLRNHRLQQFCEEQQLELLSLEQKNHAQRRLLERLQESPDRAVLLSPDSLIPQPDQLEHWKLPSTLAVPFTPASSREWEKFRQRIPHHTATAHWAAHWLPWAERLERSPELSSLILTTAFLVLVLGMISFRAENLVYWQKLWGKLFRFLTARYFSPIQQPVSAPTPSKQEAISRKN